MQQTNPFIEENKNNIQIILIIIYLISFLLPGFFFLENRGGVGFLKELDFSSGAKSLFPLVGLYAFFFVWAQFIIGTSKDFLCKVFPGIISFHRKQGVVALALAFFHPGLILLGYGISKYLEMGYVSSSLRLFVLLGYFQLGLISLTAFTALLRKLTFLRRVWLKIHYLNYVLFVSIFIHSWFLGSDVSTTNLKYLWFFFGATAIVSTIWRLNGIFLKPRQNLVQFLK